MPGVYKQTTTTGANLTSAVGVLSFTLADRAEVSAELSLSSLATATRNLTIAVTRGGVSYGADFTRNHPTARNAAIEPVELGELPAGAYTVTVASDAADTSANVTATLRGETLTPAVLPSGATHKITLPASRYDTAATGVPVSLLLEDDGALARAIGVEGRELTIVDESGVPVPQRVGYHASVAENWLWTFWSSPAACYSKLEQATYVAGFDMATRGYKMARLDHLTGRVELATLAVDPEAIIDDHNNPNVVVNQATGRVHIWASAHGETPVRYWYRDPGDTTYTERGFGAVTLPAATYHNLGVLYRPDGSQVIWGTYRTGDTPGTERPNQISFSTDDGVTWSAPVDVVRVAGERPYVFATDNGVDTIHIVYSTTHPEESTLGVSDLRHATLSWPSKELRRSDGTLIGNLDTTTLDDSNSTVVFDEAAANPWPGGLVVDGDIVQCAFLRCYNTDPGSASYNDDFDYRVATLENGTWTETNVATLPAESLGGPVNSNQNPYYAPGWSTGAKADEMLGVWQVDGTHEVRRYTLDRVTGAHTYEVLGAPHGADYVRPYPVRDAEPDSDAQVVWCAGMYAHWFQSVSDLDLVVWPSPKWAQFGTMTADVEIDFDGVTDRVLHVVAGPIGPGLPAKPLSTALASFSGDVTAKTLLSAAEAEPALNDSSVVTVIAGTRIDDEITSEENYLVSNWNQGSSSGRHVMLRLSGSAEVRGQVATPGGTREAIATDLLLTEGVSAGVAMVYSNASGLRLWKDGVESSVTGSGGANLRTSTDGQPIIVGQTPHTLWTHIEGVIYSAAVIVEEKPDDWLRMATRGLQRSGYTVETIGRPNLAGGDRRTLSGVTVAKTQATTAATQSTAANAAIADPTDGLLPIRVAAAAPNYTAFATITASGADAIVEVRPLADGEPLSFDLADIRIDGVTGVETESTVGSVATVTFAGQSALATQVVTGAITISGRDTAWRYDGTASAATVAAQAAESEAAAAKDAAENVSGGGGPVELRRVATPDMRKIPTRAGGQWTTRPLRIAAGEAPLLGWSFLRWGGDVTGMEQPSVSNDAVLVAPTEGQWGHDNDEAKLEVRLADGVAAGATAEISGFVTVEGRRVLCVTPVEVRE